MIMATDDLVLAAADGLSLLSRGLDELADILREKVNDARASGSLDPVGSPWEPDPVADTDLIIRWARHAEKMSAKNLAIATYVHVRILEENMAENRPWSLTYSAPSPTWPVGSAPPWPRCSRLLLTARPPRPPCRRPTTRVPRTT
jgi:hypothetical protein